MVAWLDIMAQVAVATWTVLAFPLKVVWALVMTLVGAVLVVLAPVIYMGSYFLSWIQAIVQFFIGLEVYLRPSRPTPSSQIMLTTVAPGPVHICQSASPLRPRAPLA